MSETEKHLLHRIDVMERKIAREKAARLEAERLLTQLTEETYLTSQALRASLRESQKREQEIKFLHAATERASEGTSLPQLVSQSIESATQFSQSAYGVAFYTNNNQVPDFFKVKVWHAEVGWHRQPQLVQDIFAQIPLEVDELYEQWSVAQLDVHKQHETEDVWLIHIMIPLQDGEKLWFCLVNYQELIDEEMLFVLDATRQYLVTGINYRLQHQELTQRDEELGEAKKNQEDLEQKLHLSDKMAMLGQMAAGVAHEINNPMGFVRSNSEIISDILGDIFGAFDALKKLAERAGPEIRNQLDEWFEGYNIDDNKEAIEELMESNHSGINRITEIVKSLRSFSHHGQQTKQLIAITDPIDNALKITHNIYKYNLELFYQPPQNPPQIIANSAQLQQVFINMITNAVHACDENGQLHIGIIDKARQVTITVRDNGCGMDEKTLEQLYTPFYTTKAPGEGTGLGMSVSFTILEDHDAVLDVESEVGKGTQFTMTFKKPNS